MPFELYDYVDVQGRNAFKEWAQGLQKPQLAKLNERIDKLKVHGEALLPEMLSGTHVAGIMKLKVKGKVQLRPMLCKGPVNCNTEFTLLAGATERDSKLIPEGVEQTAKDRRFAIEQDHTRRKKHERVA